MTQRWPVEQVLGLAPDPASGKAARGLANARRWTEAGCSDFAVWGLCRGSGSTPYQTKADLSSPAFACSCPSRKFPCKHALALLLLWAGSPSEVPEAEAPAWVLEWLQSRKERAEKQPGRSGSKHDGAAAPDPEAKARRAAGREVRVQSGIEELSRFLGDLVSQGLAAAQRRPMSFWDQAAARMVDAQATGLSRRIRRMSGAAASSDEWAGRLLEQAGLTHLLIEAYRRKESLSPGLATEVRSLVGWTVPQSDVLAGPRQRDRWQVMGQWVGDEERLRMSRTWLWGLESGRPALVLSFAAAGENLDLVAPVGSVIEASLAFYPGTGPARALVSERHGPEEAAPSLPGWATAEEALSAYAGALAANPWIERFPMALAGVTPERTGRTWEVRDPRGAALPLAVDEVRAWKMAAMSGGHPMGIFGEWTPFALRPLTVAAQGRVVPL